ncbi:lytic transglycosylase domain-containing protein [Methylobacterium dankookense]|uniref:Membrane-bound lytic murein transglycosylase C n=1 Tax=Methylobacterium dankookense TaxID=560405 RepID=A0ABQ4RMZ6_9HYPH|nr:transglycosylase SLT domain-containing protein [Methylobacterium dankookense]GJD59148.1 Membrane-bound lytic murein transglycosylase C [Methylobacterium dankookense]
MQRLILAAALAAAPAAALAQQPGARDNIDALIEQQAKANGVPASFIHAVVKRESNYNPRAKGGSALGLMQIKHATAKGLGYTGDAAGLYDPETNLRYGVAYLAGAYKTARGNLTQAYTYYNRGYYYAAKRQGVATEVAAVVAPVAASASAMASLFTGTPAAADPSLAAAGTALSYAPTLTPPLQAAAAAAPAPTETVEVPLPPRRPAALAAAVQVAALAEPAVAEPQQQAAAHAAPAPAAPAAGPQDQALAETVEVPLPPRRPSVQMLAAVLRPAVAARKAPAPVQEAAALPPQAQP